MRRVERVAARDGWVCNGCGEPCEPYDPDARPKQERYATVDHKVAGGGGGDNLWVMCNLCNSSKGSRPLEEWEKTLDFDGSYLRRGFTAVPNTILENSSLSLGARMTLISLMSFAWKGDPFPGQERLAKMLGCTDRTVREYLSELQTAGFLKVARRGRGQTNVYRIVQNAILRLPSEESSGEEPPDVDQDRKQSSALDRKQSSGEEDEVEEQPTTPPVVPPESNEVVLKRRVIMVDRKQATDDEVLLASVVLAQWNTRFDQSLTSVEWISKIIMRIREHPEYGLDEHVAIIEAAIADPWWKGAPSPSVVYGNGALFERSVEQAKQRANGRASPEKPGRYGRGLTTRQILDMTKGR